MRSSKQTHVCVAAFRSFLFACFVLLTCPAVANAQLSTPAESDDGAPSRLPTRLNGMVSCEGRECVAFRNSPQGTPFSYYFYLANRRLLRDRQYTWYRPQDLLFATAPRRYRLNRERPASRVGCEVQGSELVCPPLIPPERASEMVSAELLLSLNNATFLFACQDHRPGRPSRYFTRRNGIAPTINHSAREITWQTFRDAAPPGCGGTEIWSISNVRVLVTTDPRLTPGQELDRLTATRTQEMGSGRWPGLDQVVADRDAFRALQHRPHAPEGARADAFFDMQRLAELHLVESVNQASALRGQLQASEGNVEAQRRESARIASARDHALLERDEARHLADSRHGWRLTILVCLIGAFASGILVSVAWSRRLTHAVDRAVDQEHARGQAAVQAIQTELAQACQERETATNVLEEFRREAAGLQEAIRNKFMEVATQLQTFANQFDQMRTQPEAGGVGGFRPLAPIESDGILRRIAAKLETYLLTPIADLRTCAGYLGTSVSLIPPPEANDWKETTGDFKAPSVLSSMLRSLGSIGLPGSQNARASPVNTLRPAPHPTEASPASDDPKSPPGSK